MANDSNPRLEIPEPLRRKMVDAARQFRKEPTRSEALLWQALRGRKVAGQKIRRQQPIGPFVVDFYVPACRLVIEVDGPIHELQKAADLERQELLEMLGLRFLRIRSELVENDLPAVLGLIQAAIELTPSPLVGEGLGVRGERHHPHPPAPSPMQGEGENSD